MPLLKSMESARYALIQQGAIGGPLGVACMLLALAIGFILYRAAFSPLRHIPGPFVARFTNLWYLWRLYQGYFEQENLQLHDRYGPVVRLGPNRYSFSDPDALKAIYNGPGAANRFPKSSSYRPAGPPDPERWTLFADENIARHAKNRRLYQSTYSMSSLVTYETYVDECADLFSIRLSELADAHLPANLGYWLQCFAFDVIGLITYSKRFGFLDQGRDVGGLIRTIDDEMVYFVITGVYSSLHKLLLPIRNWWAGDKGTGRTYLMGFTRERVAEYQGQPSIVSTEDAEDDKIPLDFLSKFFGKHAADPETFTMTHVLAGCASNVVAGSDTTATSLSGVVYYLLRNPEVLERLRREIRETQRRRPGKGDLTWIETQAMPYLQAIIKEALRLHTAVALPMERVVPRGGVEICGSFFPEGTYVGINNWVYHRNEAIFGQDAREFKPERWLPRTDSDAERLGQMNRNFLPFGAGARTCIGRHIAQLQMSKLIPRLVSDFEFAFVPELEKAEWHTRNYFFLKPDNFRVRVMKSGH